MTREIPNESDKPDSCRKVFVIMENGDRGVGCYDRFAFPHSWLLLMRNDDGMTFIKAGGRLVKEWRELEQGNDYMNWEICVPQFYCSDETCLEIVREADEYCEKHCVGNKP